MRIRSQNLNFKQTNISVAFNIPITSFTKYTLDRKL